MILFDLRCPDGHVFEAWFASSTAWEDQRRAGQVACPCCGSTSLAKAVMAPAIPAKSNTRTPMPPEALKRAIAMLATEQAKMLEKSEWVGTGFARRARAIHAGDEAHATIHGQATVAEAKALLEDGVPVAPLPLPVVPPDQVN